MDITIPPYNLKRFAASITCLGKIGKDLYLSFDPLDGLTLSSLNEAKSAYGKFHFDSGFFERCSAPPVVGGSARKATRGSGVTRVGSGDGEGGGGGSDGDESDADIYDTRYVCRVPVRSVHSILRPRKGVCSLRIRSEGMDDEGNYFGLNRKKRNRKEHGHSRQRGDDDDDDDNENRRGSFSARERRSRKRRKQSRIRKNNNDDDNADDDNDDPHSSISRNTDKMMLSFEFFIERPAPKTSNNNDNSNPNVIPSGGIFRVLHKVGVTDANGITLSASVTQRRTRSEIVSPPKLWLRLLDPLRRTAEVALTIDDELKVVTATSFHPGEMAQQDNAVLQAAAARNAVLKTETSTGVEEFDEYDFRNNRGKKKRRKNNNRRQNNNNNNNNNKDDSEEDSANEERSDDEGDELDFERASERPPSDVNQKVILVFGIKEAKAMLQYCSQTSASSYDDDDGGTILSFHWGGRPIVIETEGDYFTAELVLATLHHGMIASNITVVGGDDVGSGRHGGERD